MSDLEKQVKELESWLIEAALPFWEKNGRDAEGGFYEHLHLDRTPDPDAVRRVRVQARQVYSYAKAHQRGWYKGADTARQTFDFLVKYGHKIDGQTGFVHRLNPDYSIFSDKRDLYDHAFYLLSCIYGEDILEGSRHHDIIAEILGLLDGKLKSSQGGWLEDLSHSTPRRQNPHMHLLETSLAGAKILPQYKWQSRAEAIFKLFEDHFFDQKHHIVREFFDEDWDYACGDLGETVEPGHGAEWVWLLWLYEQLTGHSTADYAQALYEKAVKGPDFLNDEEDVQGHARRDTKRLWVQTEMIKAHLVQARRQTQNSADYAARAIQNLFQYYLKTDGTWADQIDNSGNPIAETIPVSTMYHIICMIDEARTTVDGA